ncbi:MAG TPA: site-2 protease family protein [Microthrixaceae bacterium]|nr:site-2 protease family protein [Microthrixaceae bacterium]HNB94618.1 site-2 protease family protein [Microthrixaceae bacterium]
MRTSGVRLGRVFDIEISADLGVVMFAGLLTWILASSILPASVAGLPAGAYWSVAALGTLLFLGSLLAHELGHAVVARRNDIEVLGITLWLFGGVAQLRSDARTAGAELRIALAGPAMSLVVGALSLAAAVGLRSVGVPEIYVVALGWLGLVNVVLAVFNLLPGAPLDGGRVLAALIWMVRGDRLRAKVWAARAGRAVAILIVAAGAAEVFVLRSSSGLWTIMVGWFLMTAARAEESRYRSEEALGSMPVADAMDRDPSSIRSWSTVADAASGALADRGTWAAVPVVDADHRIVGVMTLARLRRLPAERWATTTVADVMLPVSQLPTATPGERVVSVLDRLRIQSGGIAVVLDQGRLVGLLTPEGIDRAISFGRRATAGPSPGGRTLIAVPPPVPDGVPVQRWEPPGGADDRR